MSNLRSVVFDGEGGMPAAQQGGGGGGGGGGGDWFGGGGGAAAAGGGAGFGVPQGMQPMYEEEDYENEPPLLKELGVDPEHIKAKTIAVLIPNKPLDDHIMDDADLAGPIVFCCALGFLLLLAGKLHFGYVYGFGAFGCVAMYVVLNLMSSNTELDLGRIFSVLGYCLLPVVFLAAVAVVFSLQGVVGFLLGSLVIAWCTYTSTRFFEKALHMTEQRYLIAYPVGLLYACFVLITVF